MTSDDFFAWLLTVAGIESEQMRLSVMSKAEEVYGKKKGFDWDKEWENIRVLLPEGSYLATCHVCEGNGFTLEPVCCGRYVVDEDNPYGSCCNKPEPVHKPCNRCMATGRIIHTPTEKIPAWMLTGNPLNHPQKTNTPPW